MNELALAFSKSIKGGTGYFFTTNDGCRIFSSDTLLYEPGVVTRKIGISVSFSCQVACRYCFTNRFCFYRGLSSSELCEQVHYVVERNPVIDSDQVFKISLKQMGDPALNSESVVAALGRLFVDFPKAMFVVSTSAPRVRSNLFTGLQKLQDCGANIRLQFSCHTTSDFERSFLSPRIPMMSLSEIGEVANNWRGQLVTLNFVFFKGYTYEVETLKKIFSPEKVFIKINYIDHHSETLKTGLSDEVVSVKEAFVEDLQTAGYQFAYRNG